MKIISLYGWRNLQLKSLDPSYCSIYSVIFELKGRYYDEIRKTSKGYGKICSNRS